MSVRELPTFETFNKCVGSRFRWNPAPEVHSELELIEAQEFPAGKRPAGIRTPFSLIFRDESGTAFPQKIYELQQDDLGAMELFLVPIGPDGRGMRFEAVFG